MPFDLEIDESRDLVKVALKGPVGAEEFLAGFAGMLAHPGFHPGTKILVDMLEHVHQVGGEDIRQIAGVFIQHREALRGSLVSVVVAKAVSYGMLRMLQTLVGEVPFTFSVFYDLDEAEQSLGLV